MMNVNESPSLSPEEEIQKLRERINFLKVQIKEKTENSVNQQEPTLVNVANLIRDENVQQTTSSLGKRSGPQDFTEVETKKSKISTQPHQQQSSAGPSSSQDTKPVFRKKRNISVSCQSYKKRKGYVDYGKEYEILMCALYAIRFTISDRVCGFEMTTNKAECDVFDDVELKVTFEKNETCSFLLQLKHRGNEEAITWRTFLEQKDFYLPNYLKSVSTVKNLNETQYFILYTNRPMTVPKNTWLSYPYHERLQLKQCTGFKNDDLLLNTEQTSCIFQFAADINWSQNTNLKDSCQRFYLFTSQKKVDVVKSEIWRLLKQLLQCDICDAFEHFMKTWWSGNFVLTKHDVIAKLTELSLSPHIRTISGNKLNEKSELLAQAIMDFDVTIVKNSDDDTVANIWAVSEENDDIDKIEKKFGINATEPTQSLWYLEMVPLIVTVDNSNIAVVQKAMKLLRRDTGNKKVILMGCVDKSEFADWEVFESLADLEHSELYDKIKSVFMVSLQGRKCIALRHLIGIDAEIAEIIKMTELLQMTQNDYLQLGPSEGALSKLHIPRKLAVTFVSTADILDNFFSTEKYIIIVNCDRKFQKMLELKNVTFMETLQYLYQDDSRTGENIFLLSITDNCTRNQFNEVVKKSRKCSVYLFQVFDEEFLFLLQKSKNAFIPWTPNDEKSLGEEKILEYFNNNTLNVICAPPGMGKSVLLKAMSSEYCPPNMWSLYVNLIKLNPFLRTKPDNETLLDHLLKLENENLTTELQQLLYRRKQMIFFLDGLDEVDSASVDLLLDFIKNLRSQGVHIWLSSRENLREKIVQTLDTVPLEIAKLDKIQQEKYMHARLKEQYNSEERPKIMAAIFNSTHVANSQELLGIPLQLYIITEIFLDSRRPYENLNKENIFLLTKMYKMFFEGKKRFMFSKTGTLGQEHQLLPYEILLSQYTILGMRTCLDVSAFEKLDIDLFAIEDLTIKIKSEGDKLGIIKEITEDDQIIFTHQTYAEYLACVWLKAHLRKLRLLREEMFSRRYQNLKLMFDVMMTEENPLHLAIIYKNMEEFAKRITDVDTNDKGGRSALQLACSYGMKYDHKPRSRRSLFHIRKDSEQYMQVIDALLKESGNVLQKDVLFDYDCMQYALASGCLYPVERFLESGKVIFENFGEMLCAHFDIETLAHHCAYLGYPQLLTLLLKENRVDVYSETFSICGLLGPAVEQKQIDTIKALIKNGTDINKIYTLEHGNLTILEYACKCDDYEIIKVLMECGAHCTDGNSVLHYFIKLGALEKGLDIADKFNIDINSRNTFGETPLHLSCKFTRIDEIKCLLERGADPSITTVLNRNLLHYAAASNNIETMEYILSLGLDVNTADLHNTTPLHIACKQGDYWTVELLEENSSDFNVVDDENRNILHYAVECEELDSDLLEYLMDHVDVRAQDSNGRNVLDYAMEKECNNAIKFLIETNDFSDYFNTKRETFLYWSIYSGCLFGVELFTDEDLDGINVNHENFPLFFATTDGHLQKKVLLKMTLFIGSLLKYTYASHKEIVAYMKHLSSKNDTIYSIFVEADDRIKMEDRINTFQIYLKHNQFIDIDYTADDWLLSEWMRNANYNPDNPYTDTLHGDY